MHKLIKNSTIALLALAILPDTSISMDYQEPIEQNYVKQPLENNTLDTETISFFDKLSKPESNKARDIVERYNIIKIQRFYKLIKIDTEVNEFINSDFWKQLELKPIKKRTEEKNKQQKKIDDLYAQLANSKNFNDFDTSLRGISKELNLNPLFKEIDRVTQIGAKLKIALNNSAYYKKFLNDQDTLYNQESKNEAKKAAVTLETNKIFGEFQNEMSYEERVLLLRQHCQRIEESDDQLKFESSIQMAKLIYGTLTYDEQNEALIKNAISSSKYLQDKVEVLILSNHEKSEE